MKIPSNILHDKQYADKILEITADTMFFVYKDGTCLDFKANTTDFFIKEQDIIGRMIHEAAIGKIAGEQLIKLMTLGLTEKEAEEQIINGFLK